jgi:putative ABC transport system permease protein
MLLPWEYGVRNLSRRPVRSALTLGALATVVLLVFIVVGFIRGLESSLAISGESDVVLVYSVNSEENIESSSIAARTPALLSASVSGTWKRFDVAHVSPELFLGTRVVTGDSVAGMGLVRGVTRHAPLVRSAVRIVAGEWPQAGEVMVGRLARAKLGVSPAALSIGRVVEFEGRSWKVSGEFAAGGAAYESEIWCNLDDFQTATQRQDLSLVALKLGPGVPPAQVALFCKERTDLELRAQSETGYYATLQRHYRPVRTLAWLVVVVTACFSGWMPLAGTGKRGQVPKMQSTPWAVPVFGT